MLCAYAWKRARVLIHARERVRTRITFVCVQEKGTGHERTLRKRLFYLA